jgi:hypothetical protein
MTITFQSFVAQCYTVLFFGDTCIRGSTNSPAQSHSPFDFKFPGDQGRKVLKKSRRRAMVAWVHDILLEELVNSCIFYGRCRRLRSSFCPRICCGDLQARDELRGEIRRIIYNKAQRCQAQRCWRKTRSFTGGPWSLAQSSWSLTRGIEWFPMSGGRGA